MKAKHFLLASALLLWTGVFGGSDLLGTCFREK